MARKPPRRWIKRTLPLKENHGWTSRPGYNIFVADRGAVRFDIPRDWVIVPGEKGSIRIHDRRPPNDDCTLEMSIFYLPDEIDWTGLPLAAMVRDVTEKDDEEDERGVLERGEVVEVRRERLELAWRETRFIDTNEHREAYSRLLIARWSNIQPLITFAFWADDRPRMDPAWDEVLRSLVLGDYVEDPTQRVLD